MNTDNLSCVESEWKSSDHDMTLKDTLTELIDFLGLSKIGNVTNSPKNSTNLKINLGLLFDETWKIFEKLRQVYDLEVKLFFCHFLTNCHPN